MRLHIAKVLVLSVFLGGCLEPLVEDAVTHRGAVLPAGSAVPSIGENAAALLRLDEYDQIDGDTLWLQSAFEGGERVWYWDFGSAPTFPQPLYMLVQPDAAGSFTIGGEPYGPIGHPPVWNVIPGDAAYSPFWQLFLVPISDSYDGQVLSSFDAVDDGLASGLLLEPVETEIIVNCPVITPTTRLQEVDGTFRESSHAYYRGMSVNYFDVGPVDLDEATYQVPIGQLFVLRREGQEPIDEALRQVDITGDGDINDTNNIFHRPEGVGTHLFDIVEIVVPDTTASIDTNSDETLADHTSYEDLFDADGRPLQGRVVATYPREQICNCPQAPRPAP